MKSESFKMLRNHNFNIFFQKKAISPSCVRISGYDIIYNSSTSNHQQLPYGQKFSKSAQAGHIFYAISADFDPDRRKKKTILR